MTDDTTPQTQPPLKKDERKAGVSNNRGPRRNVPNVNVKSNGNSSQAGTRPSSRSNNRKPTNSTAVVESGSDSGSKQGTENGKKPERNKTFGGRTTHRKGVSNSQPNRNTSSKSTASPVPQPTEGSDALYSLQNLIADLKTASPNQHVSVPPITYGPAQTTNNPMFLPMQTLPVGIGADKHRKALSLGNSASSSNIHSFSPHLGTTLEEDAFEEGEIHERFPSQAGYQTRPQPRSMPPRFVALQTQQETMDNIGPSGRPQLAPDFMFGTGTRKRAPIMGPPINEEDAGFQFPQQQGQVYPSDFSSHEFPQRKIEGGDTDGIMGQQIAIQRQIEALQQQQQALYQQQIASGTVNPLQTTNLGGIHRRAQSTMSGGPGGNFQNPMTQFGNLASLGIGIDGQSQTTPRGHGRRHSVNVVNKNGGSQSNTGLGTFAFPSIQETFEDGFTPPSGFNGGHSRQVSRADSTWRINESLGGIQNLSTFATDLAQAQAQLQSLQQFRAAAGGHHHKMASFSFPNILPNVAAAKFMGLPSMSFLQQQQQQFQNQLQQQPQRKSLFAPYLPQASLPPLLAAGKLVVGILRVNKRNRSDAYVATEVLDADIYICGSKDRNRALEGDIVAVELLDVDEVWGTKKEKEEKKRKKEENSAYDSKVARKDDKKKDDVEVEGQGLMLFEDEEVTDEVRPQFAGHVVAVVERMPGQLFSGTLGLLRPSSAATKEKQEAERREREGDRAEEPRRGPIERPKIVWFKPTDKRVPLIAIPTEQAPPDFVQNSEAYTDKLFVACIKRHPISSLHPFGTLVEELGPIGDIEVETSALLKDCNFPTEEFSDNVLKCVPPIPFTIPDPELENRQDWRHKRMFTIDPDDAKDMDDALSVEVNQDGTYDIGVHIADVSYFVKPNTALDRDARKRATSVYLVQRAVPMIPPVLSEQLCSLHPGQERLAFSVVFTVSESAKVIKKWFGKTIIKSASKLSYQEVQNVIEGKPLGDIPIIPEHDAQGLACDIKVLSDLAQQLRHERLRSGALSLDSPQLKFELDEKGLPLDCSEYEVLNSHRMIEEFMLLTNISVAQHIAVYLPEQALLRRHDSPLDRRLNNFVKRAEQLGYPMDVSSAGALMQSINAVTDPGARKLLQLLSFKTTQRAKYFCSGMLDITKYEHFSLNQPLYTHFTSPIRRYADILVHRQLDAVLQGGVDTKFAMDRDSVAKVAQQCNIKRDSAILAQEQSAHLFLCVLISDLTCRYGPVIRQAQVINVLDSAFDVLVSEFGIEKRVHVDQMPIDNHVFEEHTHTLQIYWSDRDVITWLAENSDDEHLKKVKHNAEQHALKMEVASRSVQDENALFDDNDDDEIVLGRDMDEVVKETSKQRLLSMTKVKPEFEGLRVTPAGHKVQDIRELMTVPVIITADLSKSPPVVKVYSVNPYATVSA